MSSNKIIGYTLIIGGILDISLVEIPRLTGANTSHVVNFLDVRQGATIALIFDVIIMYAGYIMIR